MDFEAIQLELEAKSGVSLTREEPLREHTSLHIGGPAALFATVRDAASAGRLIAAAAGRGVPVFVLGGGTNVLVSDEGFKGLVFRTEFLGIEVAPDCCLVRVGASVPAASLVQHTVDAGLAGLEFAAGLPGSVGGAVAGNAGCFGASFGERLIDAEVIFPDGRGEVVAPDWFRFEYRKSSAQERGVTIANASFAVAPGDREALQAAAQEHLALRRTKHPPVGAHTAGSYFKNLPPLKEGERRRAAGILLDQVGAKEVRVGDAAVFEKHANIIVNLGSATARDVLTLEARLKELVRERFGVELEPEVRFIGKRPADL